MRSYRQLRYFLPLFIFFFLHASAEAAPIVDLKANGSNGPLVVTLNEKVNLTWNNQNVTSCTGSGSWTGDKTPADTGIQTVTITKPLNTFTLTCTDGLKSVSESVQVRTTPLADDSVCNLLVVPRSMTVGQSFDATIKMRNKGTNIWIKSGLTPYKISVLPVGDTTWGISTDNFDEVSVVPGVDGNFNFSGTAPIVPETYFFEWVMMKGNTPFGIKCSTSINVGTTLPPPPPPASTCTPFSAPDFDDVPATHPNYKAVSCLRERYCLIAGVQTTDFHPDRLITRAETTAFMSGYHVFAKKDWTWKQANPPTYSDVDFNYYAYTHIETAKFFNFISAALKFNPDSNWLNGFCGITAPCPGVDTGTTRANYIQKMYDYGISNSQLPLCAAPTLTLTATPTTVNYGDKTTINWTSTNADECTATAGSTGWPGAWPTDGSWLSGSLTNTVTYTLTCSGIGGTVTKSVTVKVNLITVGLAVDLYGAEDATDWRTVWDVAPIPTGIYDHKAFVTGGTGPITYTYYCDRADTGTNVTPGWFYQGTSPVEFTELTNTACTYPNTGVYHPKVIVERDGVLVMSEPVRDGLFATKAYAQTTKLAAQDQVELTITTGASTLSVNLEANMGSGYVDEEGSGVVPLNNVDLRATVGGTATGDILYKFWCDISDPIPSYTGTVSGAGSPDVKELLDLCDYPIDGIYTAKVEVSRDGQTAADTIQITAAKSCQIVAVPRTKALANLSYPKGLDFQTLSLSLNQVLRRVLP